MFQEETDKLSTLTEVWPEAKRAFWWGCCGASIRWIYEASERSTGKAGREVMDVMGEKAVAGGRGLSLENKGLSA